MVPTRCTVGVLTPNERSAGARGIHAAAHQALLATLLSASVTLVACAPSATQTQATATPQQQTSTGSTQATSTPAPQATATTAPSGAGQAGAGQAFADVPLPSGAQEVGGAAQFNQMLAGMLAGGGLDPNSFTSVSGKVYTVNTPPRQVFDFFAASMRGWTSEAQSFQTPGFEQGGVGFWSRDGGNRIVWIVVADRSAEGLPQSSQLLVWEARR